MLSPRAYMRIPSRVHSLVNHLPQDRPTPSPPSFPYSPRESAKTKSAARTSRRTRPLFSSSLNVNWRRWALHGIHQCVQDPSKLLP